MNGIQGGKSARQKCNRLLDAVVKIIKCKKIIIDHAIYTKVSSYVTVSYLTFYTDDVINTNNNDTDFTELRRVFEEYFEMKVQEGSILKYLHFLISRSPLGIRVGHNDHITELVNEWLPTDFFRKVDATFRTEYTYEKELLAALPLTGNSLHKAEMECHGKSGHTIGRLQHISIMSTIDIFYTACRLAT